MPKEIDKNVIFKAVGAAVAVFLIVFVALEIIDWLKGTKEPEELLADIVRSINVNTAPPIPEPIPDQPPDVNTVLPAISKYPPRVEKTTSGYIEIFSSPEKAGTGTDGWLTEVAKDFNNARIRIDGREVSVRLREIPSGMGADYIISGKYRPDAYTPSNELWGEMIVSRGVRAELVEERLAGNVAGILLTRSKKDELVNKYGEINTRTIVEAVAKEEFAMGYTNPLASSTGLNFLISALYSFDSNNLLSDEATAGFESFQANIPLVAFTTLQMRNSAKKGSLDGFVLEYQTYLNTPDIRHYDFTPFGVRHDNPIYAIGDLSPEKRKILDEFIKFAKQDKYQAQATRYGFNGFDEYRSEAWWPVRGDVIVSAQRLYKDTKPRRVAVFVADVSGSMMGAPLNNLKRSLLGAQYLIGDENMIGLVSYSSDVTINLPIDRFDLGQRELFFGAVDKLQADGNTATFDAIAVAMDMLVKQKAAGPDKDPDLRPIIFLLSDGETNRGHKFKDIKPIVEGLGIPIYTIGYNADIKALKDISDINEAASINADTEDVVYKLSQMFDAELQGRNLR